ncbi:MAG: hypothetical protein NUW23_13050 [Firmicutes bacterium]|nr:hypothetical protein [Bacillota bacterium]
MRTEFALSAVLVICIGAVVHACDPWPMLREESRTIIELERQIAALETVVSRA